MAEKSAGFAINALVLTTRGEREQKDEEDGKRQFALTKEGFGGKMEVFR